MLTTLEESKLHQPGTSQHLQTLFPGGAELLSLPQSWDLAASLCPALEEPRMKMREGERPPFSLVRELIRKQKAPGGGFIPNEEAAADSFSWGDRAAGKAEAQHRAAQRSTGQEVLAGPLLMLLCWKERG